MTSTSTSTSTGANYTSENIEGSTIMQAGVNDLEWLTAVSQHPKINDQDLIVAAALILGDASSAADVLGVQPQDVTDIDGLVCDLVIRRLEALGFLAPEVVDDRELIYELCIPSPA